MTCCDKRVDLTSWSSTHFLNCTEKKNQKKVHIKMLWNNLKAASQVKLYFGSFIDKFPHKPWHYLFSHLQSLLSHTRKHADKTLDWLIYLVFHCARYTDSEILSTDDFHKHAGQNARINIKLSMSKILVA